jgi:hypothetical protein
MPFGNFTVRGAAPAARADAPESTSITAPNVCDSALSTSIPRPSRRLNSAWTKMSMRFGVRATPSWRECVPNTARMTRSGGLPPSITALRKVHSIFSSAMARTLGGNHFQASHLWQDLTARFLPRLRETEKSQLATISARRPRAFVVSSASWGINPSYRQFKPFKVTYSVQNRSPVVSISAQIWC